MAKMIIRHRSRSIGSIMIWFMAEGDDGAEATNPRLSPLVRRRDDSDLVQLTPMRQRPSEGRRNSEPPISSQTGCLIGVVCASFAQEERGGGHGETGFCGHASINPGQAENIA